MKASSCILTSLALSLFSVSVVHGLELPEVNLLFFPLKKVYLSVFDEWFWYTFHFLFWGATLVIPLDIWKTWIKIVLRDSRKPKPNTLKNRYPSRNAMLCALFCWVGSIWWRTDTRLFDMMLSGAISLRTAWAMFPKSKALIHKKKGGGLFTLFRSLVMQQPWTIHSAMVGWRENTPFCNLGISFGNLQVADTVSLVSRSFVKTWMSLAIYRDWCYGANRYLTIKQKPSYFVSSVSFLAVVLVSIQAQLEPTKNSFLSLLFFFTQTNPPPFHFTYKPSPFPHTSTSTLPDTFLPHSPNTTSLYMTQLATDLEKGHFEAALRAVRFVLQKRINQAAQISLANGKTFTKVYALSSVFVVDAG